MVEMLMNVEEYITKNSFLFAQAYGTESYGSQVYSDCEISGDECVPITSGGNNGGNTGGESGGNGGGTGTGGTTTAPNTGFFGMSQDAAISSLSGALLVVVAVVGMIMVVASRRRAVRKAHIAARVEAHASKKAVKKDGKA